MKVTEEMIKHVAKLSRLNLTGADIAMFIPDMENIIGYVDKLNELDTKNVEPTVHIIPNHNVLREDEAKPSYDREDILKNAPSQESGCFKVPGIMD